MIQKHERLKYCLLVYRCQRHSAVTESCTDSEQRTITGTCRLVGHSKFGTAQYPICPIYRIE